MRNTISASSPCSANGSGSARGITLATQDGINLCETLQNENTVRYVAGGGAPVVYQHGFCSGAGTWSAMRQRVPESHRVGWEQAYSLNPDAPIESQASDLIGRLISVGVPGSVVVAHSQGGLVARRVGQRRPDLVSGLVTIATPHEGALVAANAPSVIANQLRNAAGEYCFGDWMCDLVAETLLEAAGRYVTHGTGTLIPAAGDDQPGSALIQRVNGRSEPQYETFRRVSISMSVPNRWALFRLIGDGKTHRSRLLNNRPLEGRNYVQRADAVYKAGHLMEFMAMTIRWWVASDGFGWGCSQPGYRTYWEPCYNAADYTAHWRTENYWNRVADVLYLIGSIVTNGSTTSTAPGTRSPRRDGTAPTASCIFLRRDIPTCRAPSYRSGTQSAARKHTAEKPRVRRYWKNFRRCWNQPVYPATR
jgi:pimeloyl-ACP methyl ester carboxylesterase